MAVEANVINVDNRTIFGLRDSVPDEPGTGRKCCDSAFCSAADSCCGISINEAAKRSIDKL